MIIDPKDASGREMYFLMVSAVVPRPIAWVSTVDEEGNTNLAPFSYFQAVTSKPPIIMLAIGRRRWNGELIKKDSLRNIEATGELVVNASTEDVIQQVNASSAELPPGTSEIEALGLTTLPSDLVKPPRIKESPMHLECKLDRVLPVGDPPLTTLVLAEVVRFHIDDAIWDDQARSVDARKLRPISRLGGKLYGTLGEIIELPRPDWDQKGVKPPGSR